MVCPRVGHNWTGISRNPQYFPLGENGDVWDLVQVTGREFTLKKGPKKVPKRVIFDPSRPPKPWISETPDPLGVSRIPGNRGLGVVGYPRNHGFQYTSRSKPWISGYRDTLETLDFSILRHQIHGFGTQIP